MANDTRIGDEPSRHDLYMRNAANAKLPDKPAPDPPCCQRAKQAERERLTAAVQNRRARFKGRESAKRVAEWEWFLSELGEKLGPSVHETMSDAFERMRALAEKLEAELKEGPPLEPDEKRSWRPDTGLLFCSLCGTHLTEPHSWKECAAALHAQIAERNSAAGND